MSIKYCSTVSNTHNSVKSCDSKTSLVTSMLTYLFLLSLISSSLSQYYNGQEDYNQQATAQYNNYDEDRRPIKHPQILSHKQSLNHDGNFKYAFAAENGLLQGESIAPDGSRTGSYAYVDPTGRKITVKYKAGKEGFKILEGDHIPKAHPLLAAALQQQNPGYAADDGRQGFVPDERRPPHGQQRPIVQQFQPQPNNPFQPQFRAPIPINEGIFDRSSALNRPPLPPERNNEILPFPVAQRYKGAEDREPEYNDEPGKPNSFGSGYSFEFGG